VLQGARVSYAMLPVFRREFNRFTARLKGEILYIGHGARATLVSGTYPSRPITMTVPLGSGRADGCDRADRGEHMREPLGQPIGSYATRTSSRHEPI